MPGKAEPQSVPVMINGQRREIPLSFSPGTSEKDIEAMVNHFLENEKHAEDEKRASPQMKGGNKDYFDVGGHQVPRGPDLGGGFNKEAYAERNPGVKDDGFWSSFGSTLISPITALPKLALSAYQNGLQETAEALPQQIMDGIGSPLAKFNEGNYAGAAGDAAGMLALGGVARGLKAPRIKTGIGNAVKGGVNEMVKGDTYRAMRVGAVGGAAIGGGVSSLGTGNYGVGAGIGASTGTMLGLGTQVPRILKGMKAGWDSAQGLGYGSSWFNKGPVAASPPQPSPTGMPQQPIRPAGTNYPPPGLPPGIFTPPQPRQLAGPAPQGTIPLPPAGTAAMTGSIPPPQGMLPPPGAIPLPGEITNSAGRVINPSPQGLDVPQAPTALPVQTYPPPQVPSAPAVSQTPAPQTENIPLSQPPISSPSQEVSLQSPELTAPQPEPQLQPRKQRKAPKASDTPLEPTREAPVQSAETPAPEEEVQTSGSTGVLSKNFAQRLANEYGRPVSEIIENLKAEGYKIRSQPADAELEKMGRNRRGKDMTGERIVRKLSDKK